jgi:hypothetical protein
MIGEWLQFIQTGGVWACAALLWVQHSRYGDLRNDVQSLDSRVTAVERGS